MPVRSAALLLLIAAAAGAQTPARPAFVAPRWSVEATLGATSPFVSDGNGTTVRGSITPALAVLASWRTGPSTSALLGARGSVTAVRIDGGGSTYAGGTAVEGDLLAGLGWESAPALLGARSLALRAAADAVLLRGPSNVVPFEFANHSLAHLGGEIGAAVALVPSRPWTLAVTAQSYRLGATTADDPITHGGWVSRVLVGVGYGR